VRGFNGEPIVVQMNTERNTNLIAGNVELVDELQKYIC